MATPWTAPPWGGTAFRSCRSSGRCGSATPILSRGSHARRGRRVRLADADRIRLAGREWVAVHTPGHTDDHLCLFDPEGRVMLSGDHVLPTITPHIGGFVRNVDPLQRFFDSLDKVAAVRPDVDIGPAGARSPVQRPRRPGERAIRDHHVERLELVSVHVRGLRSADERAGDVDVPVLPPGPGTDGRQRDVRPPRAPAPRRRRTGASTPRRVPLRAGVESSRNLSRFRESGARLVTQHRHGRRLPSSSDSRAAPTSGASTAPCSSPRSRSTSPRAKAICVRCIARPHCLAGALARQEPCGVWGGEIFVDGVPVQEKRRRGRPPRVPRPPLVVSEVPDVASVPSVA